MALTHFISKKSKDTLHGVLIDDQKQIWLETSQEEIQILNLNFMDGRGLVSFVIEPMDMSSF